MHFGYWHWLNRIMLRLSGTLWLLCLLSENFTSIYMDNQFTLMTDRHPLFKLLGCNQGVPSLAAQIQRWALIPSAYQYVLEYTPGSQNE